ncbi:hypothetical protein [Winogradskyella sp. Asnod2-B02-A]|uniref:hypothetical protein n=1 Tax=Winogradskyella sp. Asnod2-B02-A TaxID=3160583 RepID=UPI00386BBA7F
MKLITSLTLLIYLILASFGFCQKRIHIDEKGDTIGQSQFLEKWRNKDLGLSRWDSIGKDKKRYATLRSNLYTAGNIDYTTIKTEIEKITPLKFNDSSIIILQYYYKDDLCSSKSDNLWTKKEINSRKNFINPLIKDYRKHNIIFISLFENGIKLNTNSKNEEEYFFLDVNNFAKENIFTSQTLCGSFAAIKPNGQILIRNGEYRVDLFEQHLKPENWSLFFNN